MRSTRLVATLVLIASSMCMGQTGPENGGHEIQAWAGGAHTVSGGIGNTGVFDAGVRYGWILTDPQLSSFLRGRFEYTVDFVPVFFVFQPANTARGISFNPLGLKWNFERHDHFSPYLELGGGVLFTNHEVPTYTNDVNFTPSAAFGTHILRAKYNWSFEVRYLHISNAGLSRFNPGLNTVQVRLGIGRFFRHK